MAQPIRQAAWKLAVQAFGAQLAYFTPIFIYSLANDVVGHLNDLHKIWVDWDFGVHDVFILREQRLYKLLLLTSNRFANLV